ncbi:hypothetical protein [Paracoccus aerius]|uniref:Restriction endonuclease n=1 Tax=Paracoccus aerius TaxID=1915382 RepID=A0ABS1S809_9RHOB|nr:hypothetical protein [Paracoccus aerius]MBL3673646.1 hypothetical protein [Paracoccus aerius]GHG22413.1 hypothetical protein GCM10017322_19950 [Paracoccus aerius]
MPSPFEVSFAEIEQNIELYVDEVFSTLQSDFMTMPKGEGFLEYPIFEDGYEALKKNTKGFSILDTESILRLSFEKPIVLIVLRAMLGFTPPEWADAATAEIKLEVPQNAARAIDRRVRLRPGVPLKTSGVTAERVRALVIAACRLLTTGPELVDGKLIHRLSKADTISGLASIAPLADLGVPYSMLLYERFLGRPFAGHRDSVSELVGDVVELAIEELLTKHHISFRKTKRAERIAGFEQAPDFIIPSEYNPRIVIEAKLTNDDGTARDKVTRVQHLRTMSLKDRSLKEGPRYEVIACIAGRGFKQRRQDMKKLLEATQGKIFTLQTIPEMVQYSSLKNYVTR